MEKLQITNLKIGGDIGIVDAEPIPLHIAVRKELKPLSGIIDKAMKRITDDELRPINQKWLGKERPVQDIRSQLTDEEQAWIREHPRITANGDEWWFFVIRNTQGIYSGVLV